jgi:acyl carrier protein
MKAADRVRKVIAEALYVDQEAVQPQSSLMKDLGAESIDFLDIVFRLEKEFSIKLPKGELERRARGGLTDAEFAQDGKLTAAAVANLKTAMPEAPTELVRVGMPVREIPSLFTVQTFVRLVEDQLFGSMGAAEAGMPAAAGGQAETSA